MAEQEVVVARIVGKELVVERYRCQPRSDSSLRYTEEDLEEAIRRIRPHLLVWSAPDERGRRLAKALREREAEGDWQPGCIEVSGWTDVPFSELVRLMCRVRAEHPAEARLPAEAEEAPQPPEPKVTSERPISGEEGTEEGRPSSEQAGASAAQVEELGERLALVLAVRAERRTAEE